MPDIIELIGLVAIGAVLAAPLAYGVATLLGMTHKQFRPIFRVKRLNGMTAPIISDAKEQLVGDLQRDHEQPRRYSW